MRIHLAMASLAFVLTACNTGEGTVLGFWGGNLSDCVNGQDLEGTGVTMTVLSTTGRTNDSTLLFSVATADGEVCSADSLPGFDATQTSFMQAVEGECDGTPFFYDLDIVVEEDVAMGTVTITFGDDEPIDCGVDLERAEVE